jgi:hypothetical protein
LKMPASGKGGVSSSVTTATTLRGPQTVDIEAEASPDLPNVLDQEVGASPGRKVRLGGPVRVLSSKPAA